MGRREKGGRRRENSRTLLRPDPLSRVSLPSPSLHVPLLCYVPRKVLSLSAWPGSSVAAHILKVPLRSLLTTMSIDGW